VLISLFHLLLHKQCQQRRREEEEEEEDVLLHGGRTPPGGAFIGLIEEEKKAHSKINLKVSLPKNRCERITWCSSLEKWHQTPNNVQTMC